MGIITNATRMWLTRTRRPFTFTPEYDRQLPYEDCTHLGLYVHIPFCKQICSFCPYCKELYAKEKCDRYIDALLKEIHMVGRQNTGRKKVTSLYFGGGSPALAADRLGEIIEILSLYFDITDGIGVELHPDNVTVPVLRTLKEAGVSRISIGIQSFRKCHQDTLGRTGLDPAAMTAALREVPFDTVSMDLIFALPGQTFESLKDDVDTAYASGANHVAIYPFIDFTFTASPVKAMEKNAKRELLDQITNHLLEKGYHRDSIWTFSHGPEIKYSSMTRETFLGFGCSATTLLRDQFKINTFHVEEYIRRIEDKQLPTSLTCRFTPHQRMVYWLFWAAYSTHVVEADFEAFFGVPLDKEYGFELRLAKLLGFVTHENGIWSMTLKGAFYYHYYENFYTLAYIDKMWGIMRQEAFPTGIEL